LLKYASKIIFNTYKKIFMPLKKYKNHKKEKNLMNLFLHRAMVS